MYLVKSPVLPVIESKSVVRRLRAGASPTTSSLLVGRFASYIIFWELVPLSPPLFYRSGELKSHIARCIRFPRKHRLRTTETKAPPKINRLTKSPHKQDKRNKPPKMPKRPRTPIFRSRTRYPVPRGYNISQMPSLDPLSRTYISTNSHQMSSHCSS